MFFCDGTECSSSPGDYRSRAKRRSPWKAIPYIGRLSAAARLEGRIRSSVRHFSREEIRSLSFLSVENIFHVHLQLFALIGLALQPQDAGMPCVSTYVESFGERNCL